MKLNRCHSTILPFLLIILSSFSVLAQTDNDAIMMNKYQWCSGATYMHSSWDQYWEGTFKRSNANIGTVTTQSVMAMSNYGITNNLNVMVNAPYVWTQASAGTLHGMKGFQDVAAYVKWKPVTLPLANGKFSLFTIGGFSTPLTNYVIDFLPLSIGLGSSNLSGRLMAYYKTGIFYVRLSGAYIWRSNVKLDRTAYYTTSQHNTNEVQMPDQTDFNGALGIYKKYLIAEIHVDRTTTLGGFDMRKNDMPFVSNRMNTASVGAHVKYTLPFYTHVALLGDVDRVVAGRNVGQATSFSMGAFFAFYVKQKRGFQEQSQKTN